MQWETDENLTFYLLERGGGGNFTHTHPPPKATHNEKSKLHIQSLEMPNTISYRAAEYSTCGHFPPDWARLFISSTVFLRESWSARDTNTGRMYLIRAEEGKQKQGPAFIFPLLEKDPLPSLVLWTKIFVQKNTTILLHYTAKSNTQLNYCSFIEIFSYVYVRKTVFTILAFCILIFKRSAQIM